MKVDNSPNLPPALIKYIQQVTGKFLYYARAIDNTMIHAINDIASGANIQSTYDAAIYFLNYAACNPNAEVIYRASDMILNVDATQHT